jgi:hypothetical protein
MRVGLAAGSDKRYWSDKIITQQNGTLDCGVPGISTIYLSATTYMTWYQRHSHSKRNQAHVQCKSEGEFSELWSLRCAQEVCGLYKARRNGTHSMKCLTEPTATSTYLNQRTALQESEV